MLVPAPDDPILVSDPLDRMRYPIDEWALTEAEYSHDDLGVTETLFAVGNGYLGLRGNVEEGRETHSHGTFINGFHETWPIRHAEEAFGFARTGPDHRQRPRQQDHEALRRRRTDAAQRRRHRGLRADPGLPERGAAPGDHLAHPGRQAGPGDLQADGVLHPAAPGDHDLRGHHARRRCTGGDQLADPQPAGRPRRVPRAECRDGRRRRPAPGGGLQRPGARAAEPLVARQADHPELALRQLEDDHRRRQ